MTHRAVVSLIAVLGLALPVLAQSGADHKQPAAPKQPETKPAAKHEAQPGQASMEEWMKISSPSDHHKVLEAMVGTFTAKCKFWMDGPTGAATESTGSATSKWVLGGRFIQSEYKGEFMNQPFEGIGYMGYDNGANKYVGSWMDTVSTMIATSSGTYDAEKKTLTMTGSYTDPKGNVVKSKDVVTIIDNNTHKFEMYQVGPDGKDVKAGEIVYTRSAAPAKPAAPATGTKPAGSK